MFPKASGTAAAERYEAGSVCDAPVNLLSLYPTLLDLCGLPAKEDNDGPSLLPFLADPAGSDWKHDSVTFLSRPGSYAMSGRTNRYIHYADGGENCTTSKRILTNGPISLRTIRRQTLAEFREAAPDEFAQRVEPSVTSLSKLDWQPPAMTPYPRPDPTGIRSRFISRISERGSGAVLDGR